MLAKVAFLCATLVAVSAGVLHGVSLGHTGVSTSSRHQDAHGNYAFGYDIADAHGASNSRSEVGDGHGNKKGSYTLHDKDGRARRVDYVADGHGFRAVVKTNEPGTAHSAPAAAIIASPYAGPVAPVVGHAAPFAHAAPIHHAATISHVATAPLAHGAVLNTGLLGIGHEGVLAGHGLGLGHGIGHGGILAGHGLGLGHGVGLHGLGLGMGHGLIGNGLHY